MSAGRFSGPLGWIALGIGAWLAFTLARFPAAVAYDWFVPGEVRLADIRGTVWDGSAAIGSVPGLPLRDLRWRISGPALLLGRIQGRFETRLADGFANARVAATRRRVQLDDLQASTRLATLRGLLPVQDSEGQISVALDRLTLVDGWPVNVVGTLRIGGLAVPPLLADGSGALIELGDYEVDFQDSGDQGIDARFRDTGGPLDVTGSLTVGLDRRYELSGLVRARSDASAELVQGVDMIAGEPNSEGQRPFSFPGSL